MRTMLADSDDDLLTHKNADFQEWASLLRCHCLEYGEYLPISRHSAERYICVESKPQVSRHMESNDDEEFGQ